MTYEGEVDYETELMCTFCGEDRFRNALGQSIHSWYYCQQNPNRLEPPKPKNELWDGPQYYYPVQEDLERQRERREQKQRLEQEQQNQRQEQEQQNQRQEQNQEQK
jgi:hypothetical protein